ncbi:MAG: DNA polymerase III subunit gamma/tau [Acidiferrobacter sp.]
MSYLVLARKWRPRKFSELIGQEPVVRALQYALSQERLHHAYLFSGIRGVGKTTVARILAKALNCERGIVAEPCGECRSCQEIDEGRFVDLLEVDAASRTRVDDTRELLDNVQYAPTRGRFKVYLIDEVHMLSSHSFNALLKTLEEPPPHVKFILATTDPQRLPVTVLSRCLKFSLRRLSVVQITDQLRAVLTSEQIAFDEEALAPLAVAADGSLRDALSLLDQAVASSGGAVRAPAVREILGSVAPELMARMISALIAADGPALIKVADDAYALGISADAVLVALLRVFHEAALVQAIGEGNDGRPTWVLDAAREIVADELQLFYEIGLLGRRQLVMAPDPEAGLQMTLLRLLAFKPEANDTAGKTASRVLPVPVVPRSSPPPSDAMPGGDREPGAAVDREVLAHRPEAAGAENGAAVLEALSLTGLMRHLAQNALLVRDGDRVQLTLDPGVGGLLTAARAEVLKAALTSYYGSPVRLDITVGAAAASPANLRRQADQASREHAHDVLAHDPAVEALQREFNAQIKVDSVRPRATDNRGTKS